MKNFSKKVLVLAVVLVLALSIVIFAACNNKTTPGGGDGAAKVVRISTTTSVNDSGLMEYLRPYFEADTGYKWEIASAGTGAAINAARYGNADVILVHSKKSEEEFVEQGFSYKVSGYASERVSFMHNFFVLVGPTTDPANVAAVKADTTKNVKDAFKAIADTSSTFISRGDKSGTHNKEVTLWPAELGIATADGKPAEPVPTLSWYKSMGQGMGACLNAAKEQNGYVLTDKATFLSYKNDPAGDKLPNLQILWEEDASMKNTYSILCVKKDGPFKDSVTGDLLPAGSVSIDTVAAETFLNWMTGEHASALIAYYGVTKYGGSLFTLDSGYRAAA